MNHWVGIASGSGVSSPGIGTWIPACRDGEMISAGQRIGTIIRAGKEWAVCAPSGKCAVASEVCPPHSPVEYGSLLLSWGNADEVSESEERSGMNVPEGVLEVRSAMAGTLYKQPSPGAPAFAAEGVQVDAQNTLGLVEVMKSLNPVRSPVKGRIERWLVDDGDAVSAGDVLLWIRPDAPKD